MVHIELSEEDAAILARNLEWLVTEAYMEAADTDSGTFREGVKRQKAVLRQVIDQIKVAMPVRQP